MEFEQVADLTNPETGKTYREENNMKQHNIPLGTLVEVDFDDSFLDSPKKGLRLFVVSHDRDCDGTPLYSLSFNRDWKMIEGLPKIASLMNCDSGYNEDCLKVIELEDDMWKDGIEGSALFGRFRDEEDKI